MLGPMLLVDRRLNAEENSVRLGKRRVLGGRSQAATGRDLRQQLSQARLLELDRTLAPANGRNALRLAVHTGDAEAGLCKETRQGQASVPKPDHGDRRAAIADPRLKPFE